MNWIDMKNEGDLTELIEKSHEKPQVIFKHSIRCGISAMAKSRLERSIAPENADFHFLDLISHRSISDKVSKVFNVYHESPQILIIKNGECVYDESHGSITMTDIEEQISI